MEVTLKTEPRDEQVKGAAETYRTQITEEIAQYNSALVKVTLKTESRDEQVEGAVETYRTRITEEIAQYNSALVKAESELGHYKHRSLPVVELTDSQSNFLRERPDYIKYLDTLKRYHEKVSIQQEMKMVKMREKLMTGVEVLNMNINKIHK